MKMDWTFTMEQPWTLDRVLDFVSISNRYACNVYVIVNGIRLNAKGLLGIVSMSLSLDKQTTVTLQLDGIDAPEAFEDVSVFLQNPDPTVLTAFSQSS